jgi:hypothetical protein
LNTFGYGNLVDFNKNVSGTTVQYPYLFVVPQSITYNENTTNYQFSMLFTDILDYTRYNEKDIVSDMSLEARRFLSYLKRGIHTFPELYNNLDVELPANAIPFLERMGDHVAGVALDVNLIIFEDLNACDYYEPTPTITPTNTTTPTPTPTIGLTPTQTETPTLTPTPTLTETPTNTPTQTETPTTTPTPTETITQTPTLTPTITSTPPFDCSWSAITEQWQVNINDWDDCQPVPPMSPTPTPTFTPTPSPTFIPGDFILAETGDILQAENNDLIEYE